jgi:hypothetical protein
MTMQDHRRETLVMRWIVVTDAQGREHLEARWVVESGTGHTSVHQAA